MSASLVGSEMCIRDSSSPPFPPLPSPPPLPPPLLAPGPPHAVLVEEQEALLVVGEDRARPRQVNAVVAHIPEDA
eukprot:3596000-Alexandrium_andersonii.AAC.1